jgi:hypothetical protein
MVFLRALRAIVQRAGDHEPDEEAAQQEFFADVLPNH